MLAVLEDAVRVYQVGCLSSHTGGRLQFRETAWNGSPPRHVLTVLLRHDLRAFGLDPDFLRSGLRRWKERHAPKARAPRSSSRSRPGTPGARGACACHHPPAPAATEIPSEVVARR
jgi:hypothetical protein